MADDAQKRLDALRELVEQVESSNARDDHGHPLKNLKALRDARAIVDEAKGAKQAPQQMKGLPVNDDPAIEGSTDGEADEESEAHQARQPST